MLNGAAVTELTVESGPKALMAEWLGKWFDGGLHALGTNEAVTFPRARLMFDQGKALMPLHKPGEEGTNPGVEIQTFIDPGSQSFTGVDEGREIEQEVNIQFVVRARVPDAGEGNSNAMVNRVGDLLTAICNSPAAKIELAQKGVHGLMPRKPGAVEAKQGGAVRVLRCTAKLRFTAKFGK